MPAPLAGRSCKPLPKGTPALAKTQIDEYLRELPGWSIQGGKLTRSFNFKNYYETTAFFNATAWISHREDHHPDVAIFYNKLTMAYSTHSVGGLSENDFICAAKVSGLAPA